MCKLWFQIVARPLQPLPLSIWKLQALWWLRKENSVHRGAPPLLPSLAHSPVQASPSFPPLLWVEAQKDTPFQPLDCAAFSRWTGPIFYLESTFSCFNSSPSPAMDTNALKPSEDHLLAEWSHSDYGLAVTHTLVVSLCLPWTFYSSWSSLSPGNLELSDFSIFLLPLQHLHDPFTTNVFIKVCVCTCMQVHVL